MVKNLEGGVKFFMFPRFLQVFLNKQVDGMNKHKETFVVSSHTKKVFANMRRQSDGFSGVVTSLFDNMLIQASEEIGEDSGHLTNSTQIPIDDQPSTSTAPKKTQKSRRRQRKEAEAKEIAILKKRVKKLERKRRSRPTGLRRLKKGRKIAEIDQDENVNLIDETQEQLNDEEMFRVNDLRGEEVTVEDTAAEEIVTAAPIIPVTTAEVVTTVNAPTTSIEELNLAQTLIEIKAAKPKTITAITTDATSVTTAVVTRPKAKGIGKGIMIKPERPLKIKDQIVADEELARQLEAEMQAKIEEEERIRRKKEEEATLALIKLWENKQAMMEADRLLVERLQTREREELSIEEKSKLFVELMNKRRKHFAELRAQEKRNKPPTKAQKRKLKRVNSFIPMDADDRTDKEQERISKRGGDDLQSNVSKKQKVDEQIETKKYTCKQTLLASKPPTIVEYKIIKEGIIRYFQLIRADGSSKRPDDEYERVLWGDLKVMFEPDIMSDVCRSLQGYKVLIWKLFDSCGVHYVRFSIVVKNGNKVLKRTDGTVEQTYEPTTAEEKLFEAWLISSSY
ncbi:hypothetical protein Tco_1075056 [Tanacetum coccineum]